MRKDLNLVFTEPKRFLIYRTDSKCIGMFENRRDMSSIVSPATLLHGRIETDMTLDDIFEPDYEGLVAKPRTIFHQLKISRLAV